VRFSYRMVPEVYQVFWAGMAAGEFINDAAIAAGSYRKQGARWLTAVGGVRPRRGRNLKGRCLRLAQREEIALGRPAVTRSGPSGSGASRARHVRSAAPQVRLLAGYGALTRAGARANAASVSAMRRRMISVTGRISLMPPAV
jgi:hypothetical protein